MEGGCDGVGGRVGVLGFNGFSLFGGIFHVRIAGVEERYYLGTGIPFKVVTGRSWTRLFSQS